MPSNVNRPVCGSDGQTYKNLVALQLVACQEQRWIVPRHTGRCATGKFISYFSNFFAMLKQKLSPAGRRQKIINSVRLKNT